MQALEASLIRLKTDHIDLYQVHNFDTVTPIEEVLRTLDDMVRQGKVRYIGCSNYAGWQIAKALGISGEHKLEKFASVQSFYSLACRDIEHELLPAIKDSKPDCYAGALLQEACFQANLTAVVVMRPLQDAQKLNFHPLIKAWHGTSWMFSKQFLKNTALLLPASQ